MYIEGYHLIINHHQSLAFGRWLGSNCSRIGASLVLAVVSLEVVHFVFDVVVDMRHLTPKTADLGWGPQTVSEDSTCDRLDNHIFVLCAVNVGVDSPDVIGMHLIASEGLQSSLHSIIELRDLKNLCSLRDSSGAVEDEASELGKVKDSLGLSAGLHPLEDVKIGIACGTGHQDGLAMRLDSLGDEDGRESHSKVLGKAGQKFGDFASLGILVQHLGLQAQSDSTLECHRDLLKRVQHVG